MGWDRIWATWAKLEERGSTRTVWHLGGPVSPGEGRAGQRWFLGALRTRGRLSLVQAQRVSMDGNCPAVRSKGKRQQSLQGKDACLPRAVWSAPELHPLIPQPLGFPDDQ